MCIQYVCVHECMSHTVHVHIHTYIHEGKDEAMASRGVIFQSVAGRESGVTVLVVSFAIFISTRPDLRDFLTSIRSVQNYNRFLVYLTIYRSIEI
jgi:hypothetical protein